LSVYLVAFPVSSCFSSIFHVDEQEGYLVTETGEEYVSAGSDAYIFCESPLHDCTLMNWYKYEEYDEVPHVITIYNLENGIYLRDKYDVESRDGSCQLTIKDVAINDTGMYYCEIVISRRPYEGETILWVTGKLHPIIFYNEIKFKGQIQADCYR